jgi:steroid Delta-isomerase
MPDAAARAQAITDTVHRYLEAVSNGGAADMAAFSADDADP